MCFTVSVLPRGVLPSQLHMPKSIPETSGERLAVGLLVGR